MQSSHTKCDKLSLITFVITETEVKNAIKEIINQRVISIGNRRAKYKSIEKYRNLDSQYIWLCHLAKFKDYEHDGDSPSSCSCQTIKD